MKSIARKLFTTSQQKQFTKTCLSLKQFSTALLFPIENTKLLQKFLEASPGNQEKYFKKILTQLKLNQFEKIQLKQVENLTENEKKLFELIQKFLTFHNDKTLKITENFDYFCEMLKDEKNVNWLSIHLIIALYFTNIRSFDHAIHLYETLTMKLTTLISDDSKNKDVQNTLLSVMIYSSVNEYFAGRLERAYSALEEARIVIEKLPEDLMINSTYHHYKGLFSLRKNDLNGAKINLYESCGLIEKMKSVDKNYAKMIIVNYRNLTRIEQQLKNHKLATMFASKAMENAFIHKMDQIETLHALFFALLNANFIDQAKDALKMENETFNTLQEKLSEREIVNHYTFNIKATETMKMNTEMFYSFEKYLSYLSKNLDISIVQQVEFHYFSKLADYCEHEKANDYISKTDRQFDLEKVYLDALLLSSSVDDEEILSLAKSYQQKGNDQLIDFLNTLLITMGRDKEAINL
eukprot:gene8627-574_t